MAHEKQGKCVECGKSITDMPEDSDPEEIICDECYERIQGELQKLADQLKDR